MARRKNLARFTLAALTLAALGSIAASVTGPLSKHAAGPPEADTRLPGDPGTVADYFFLVVVVVEDGATGGGGGSEPGSLMRLNWTKPGWGLSLTLVKSPPT